jgi:transcriptional regulator with XRE-family HTH domain
VQSTIAEKLGQVIRSLRQEAGMSQVVFGEKCGFYQTYLSRVENGRANPTLNALEVIAKSLGISIFDLFDHVRERFPEKAIRSKN